MLYAVSDRKKGIAAIFSKQEDAIKYCKDSINAIIDARSITQWAVYEPQNIEVPLMRDHRVAILLRDESIDIKEDIIEYIIKAIVPDIDFRNHTEYYIKILKGE